MGQIALIQKSRQRSARRQFLYNAHDVLIHEIPPYFYAEDFTNLKYEDCGRENVFPKEPFPRRQCRPHGYSKLCQFFSHNITIAPGDVLRVKLAIHQTRDSTTGIYSNVRYEVAQVYEHVPRIRQVGLLSQGEEP